MTRRMKIGVVAVAVLVMAILVGLLWAVTTKRSTPGQFFDTSISIVGAMGGADVVLVAEDPKQFPGGDYEYARVESWEVTVIDVLFEATNLSGQWETPDKPLSIPVLEERSTIIVSDVQPPARPVPRFDLASHSGSRLVLLLTYNDPDRLRGVPSPWTIAGIGAIGPGDSVAMLHANAGAHLSSQLSATRDALATATTDVDLLVAWAAEYDAARGGAETGVVQDAFVAAHQEDGAEEWYALPATERPLDVELTPHDVLVGLREVPVVVEVSPPEQADDRYLIIRSASGTMHVAVLSAGNHFTSLLAAPGYDWDIVVSDAPQGGTEQLLGRVPSSDWESLGGETIHIHIRALSVGASVTALAPDRVTELLESWSEETQEPQGEPSR